MKKIAIAGLLGMCALTAHGQYKQINMTVFGMDCPPCAFAIRLSMKGIQGVSGVNVDLNKGLVSIKLTAGSTAELTPFAQGVDVTALSGKTVFVQGVLPQSARGKVPAVLRYKTIAVAP
jgi:copper chaperone CopZ